VTDLNDLTLMGLVVLPLCSAALGYIVGGLFRAVVYGSAGVSYLGLCVLGIQPDIVSAGFCAFLIADFMGAFGDWPRKNP